MALHRKHIQSIADICKAAMWSTPLIHKAMYEHSCKLELVKLPSGSFDLCTLHCLGDYCFTVGAEHAPVNG